MIDKIAIKKLEIELLYINLFKITPHGKTPYLITGCFFTA